MFDSFSWLLLPWPAHSGYNIANYLKNVEH